MRSAPTRPSPPRCDYYTPVRLLQCKCSFMWCTHRELACWCAVIDADMHGGVRRVRRIAPAIRPLIVALCASIRAGVRRYMQQAQRLRGKPEIDVHVSVSMCAPTTKGSVGPSTRNEEMIEAMWQGGVDVFRVPLPSAAARSKGDWGH